MRILIFGATTFVGRLVVKKFIKSKFKVDCVTRNITNMSSFINDDVNVIEFDLHIQQNFPIEKEYDLCVFMADSSLIKVFPKNIDCKKIIFINSAVFILKRNLGIHPILLS